MDDTGPAHSSDVQRNLAGSRFDDAQNDAPDPDSATMADDPDTLGFAQDALLSRLLTAWTRLDDSDRQRLADDAERLAKGC